MATNKIPRLSVGWESSAELFRRYWDTLSNVVEDLNSKPILVSELSDTPTVVRRIVSDANATTFSSIVTGGGSNKVPVYFDGTNWRIG